MKKIALTLVLLSLLTAVLGGCAKDNNDGKKQSNKKIVVGASITPHAEILERQKYIGR